MRSLNKIIFINSAASNYAEISLDGNVHLIGTQGVGKSTLLRAILFFYNADKTKLGIPREKKNFDQYYFPFQNSYIIYEVKREDIIYSVIAFKSQGRVAFRFFDARYRQDYFIDETGKAFLPIEQTSSGFGKEVYYTRIVHNYEEYRNIIYGNNKGLAAEFRKYALLESRQFQNIPRTIQNVFLNSKLDAAFIKETIIKSLSEEEIKIDLSTYAHNHLRNFETELNDIRIWSQKNKAGKIIVRTQAETVAKAKRAYSFTEQEKKSFVKQLGWFLNGIKISKPKLEKDLNKSREEEGKYKTRLGSYQDSFKKQQQALKTQIGVITNTLKDLKESKAGYDAKNIEELLPRIGGKSQLVVSKQELQGQRRLLTAKFEYIEQKYLARLNQFEIQLEKFQNKITGEKLEQKETFGVFKDNLRLQYEGIIAQIKSQYSDSLLTAENEIQKINDLIQGIGIREVKIQLKRFFEKELEAIKAEKAALIAKTSKAEITVENAWMEISHLRKQWELEDKDTENSHKLRIEEVNKSLQEIEKKISVTQAKLSDSKGSFYNWLNIHIPGWEKSIGRVIDQEHVLWNKGLNPTMSEIAPGNFYGVNLDLNAIDKQVKTLEDYENDLLTFSGESFAQQNIKTKTEENLVKEKGNLKKKFLPKINKLKEEISTQEYQKDQFSRGLTKTENELDELTKKAAAEKEIANQKIQEALKELKGKKQQAEEGLEKLNARLKRETSAKNKEQKDLLLQEEENMESRLQILELRAREKEQETAERIKEIKDEEKSELVKKGANTGGIGIIDKGIEEIDKELSFIEANTPLVIEYQKDKRDWFDKEPEFRNQRSLLHKELESKEVDYNKKEQSLRDQLKVHREVVTKLELEKEQLLKDLEKYEEFKKLEWFPMLEKFLEQSTPADSTAFNGTRIIESIKEKQYVSSEKLANLKEVITKFTGNFGEDNIFNFKTRFNNTTDFLNFAEDLKEFLEEDKISEYENRVNERFSHIIRQIGKETGEMLSKEGEINQVIKKINTDFVAKNFVGAIKSMEMRTVESSNKIMKLLVEIKSFNDENGMILGETNLFSSEDQNANNEKAVKLLKQLLSEINFFKADELKLSDSFGLEFRIVENENDSQWVEKLSNVGSEGTDVLVKAMINIMLLNVFKENASKKFSGFKLHCMMDEIGRLHPNNVKGILKFANDRNILLINGSPTSYNATEYRYTYLLSKNEQNKTTVKRLVHKIPTVKSL